MESSKGSVMTISEIQENLYAWAMDRREIFNAPYGIQTGRESDKGDKQRVTVTMGMARGIDIVVSIYNPRYIEVVDTRNGAQLYQSFPDLMDDFNRQYGRNEA